MTPRTVPIAQKSVPLVPKIDIVKLYSGALFMILVYGFCCVLMDRTVSEYVLAVAMICDTALIINYFW